MKEFYCEQKCIHHGSKEKDEQNLEKPMINKLHLSNQIALCLCMCRLLYFEKKGERKTFSLLKRFSLKSSNIN